MAKAVVVVTDARFTLLPSTGRELAEGLRQLGHDVELAVIPDARSADPALFNEMFDGVCRRLQALVDKGDDFFVVDMNCHLKYSQVRRQSMRRFSYVTDAPWSVFESVFSVPDDTTISYVDRHHAEFYARFPTGRPMAFMPHGGPPADPEWFEDRPIQVLFLGNLAPPCRMEHLAAITAGLPAPANDAARLALDLILEEGTEPFRAVLDGLTAFGLSIDSIGVQAFIHLLRFVCKFAESHNRYRLLTSLGKVRISVAGYVDGAFFERMPENLSLLGAVDETAAMALLRRSRIVLNSVTVFPAGSHERVWYGMALGAAACTDRSTFIEETLDWGTHVLSLDEAVASGGESLADRLAAAGGVLNCARAARDIYAAHHGWRQRARIIHRAMGYGDAPPSPRQGA
jgi:hypothetical protein